MGKKDRNTMSASLRKELTTGSNIAKVVFSFPEPLYLFS